MTHLPIFTLTTWTENKANTRTKQLSKLTILIFLTNKIAKFQDMTQDIFFFNKTVKTKKKNKQNNF